MSTRELTADRTRRHRGAAAPVWPPHLPPLDVDERELLTDWLRGSADSRPWPSLLDIAGPGRIDLADRLADKALAAGLFTLKEKFERGRWQRAGVAWVELEALQTALGLPTKSQRDAQRQALCDQIDTLMADPLVGEAAQDLAQSRMALKPAQARAALLQALAAWVAAGQQGLRRDFALHLGHTKAVADGEWAWLERHFDLPALGIGPFAPTLTLAGAASLVWPGGRRVDLAALPFVTLPTEGLERLLAVEPAPTRWWLIENRASFEKQAARLAPGTLLVWIAGRPTRAWTTALGRLLALAPAPAAISADADPAGIEIALAAAQPWVNRDLPWQPEAMEAVRLSHPRAQALGAYDLATLDRLGHTELPPMLAALRDAMRERGLKAEQEGWL
ncbi:DUF2399 domain-containing protein [Roseateles sp.]|uniref:DUF2399 domain-containing protein n=1 Tax=Roseateles sp. TaxID=1971397 RepID=UPI00326743ED